MSSHLPNTIEGLRARLKAGEWTVGDAIKQQAQDFARVNSLTKAAVSCFKSPAGLPDASLPLAGVAVAHKDIFALSNRRAGLGRDAGNEQLGLRQASVVQKLEQAGATNLGALAMAEDACSAVGHTQKLPTPINPLGEDLAVGGSSSGSAVAVASGMVYASLGTDTAGSVRIPAMTCGVMGLKTTHGLIARDGMSLLCPSLDSIGVLARSTADLVSVMKVLAPDLDWDGGQESANLKIGYWLQGTAIEEEIRDLVVPVMRGHAQEHLDISLHEERATTLQELVMAYEVGQTQAARIATGQACREVQGLGTYGLSIPHAWWREALQRRSACLRAFVEQVFGQVDVLLVPLQTALLPKCREVYSGDPAFDRAKLLGLHRYCGWVNYLGLPALALPIANDNDGLPVSVQLVAKPFHEPQLLALGRQIEQSIHREHGIMPVLRIEGQRA